MRLITWNIQWGCGVDGRVDLRRIVDAARAMADFDVLCVQEVADNFPSLAGNDDRDQFAELGRLLPGYRRAEVFGVDVAGDGARRRRFGNALFTRYDLLAVRRHALPWPLDTERSTMPRAALEATLQAPLGPIRVTTTHLEYYSDAQRRAQVARLRHLNDEACQRAWHRARDAGNGGPLGATPHSSLGVLVGDFNFPPGDPAYEDLQQPLASGPGRYRDAWRIVNRRNPHTPTFCVHSDVYSKTPYCCDFAFVTEELVPRVRGVRVDSATLASDHQPVLLELDDR